jgi:peptide chain release factor 3
LSDRTPSPVAQAAAHRRTFAIISHPDAGKTTLTEKLLLMGGAIHLAGEVKAKGERRRARSDWMKIEQQRGISVTTSVMTFEYGGCTFNLLDTPGHEDFSEDTYRTLTAVDSAVMVIDAAKGIEPQTLKLFQVCRLRDVPIMTFVNKFDREAKDPIELLDEIADKLQLEVAPANWPIGMGQNFRGVFDLRSRKVVLLTDGDGQIPEEMVDRRSNSLSTRVSEAQLDELDQTLELVEGALPSFEEASYREGHLTPAFFGSALKNFGVRALLDSLAAHAPSPRAQASETREVEPEEDKVTGFVFKVQANMDPNHRDRIAFARLCSGKLNRGMKAKLIRTGRPMTLSAPQFFFAQDRSVADEAYAGDIVGIPNHGTLSVGDTLTEGAVVKVTGIPNFAPEIIRRVRLSDPIKAKQLGKALSDLAEEGVAQVFRRMIGGDYVVGVVGQLQLEVLQARILKEYSVPISFESINFEMARWVRSDDRKALEQFITAQKLEFAEDKDGDPVYLAQSAWWLGRAQRDNPKVEFLATKERI